MNNPFSKSLSLRLLAIFLATAVLLIVILSSQFKRGLGFQWRHNIQPHLFQYIEFLERDIGQPPNHQIAQQLANSLPIEIYIFYKEALEYSTNGENINLDSINLKTVQPPAHKFRSQKNRRSDNSTSDKVNNTDTDESPNNVMAAVDRHAGTQYLSSSMGDYLLLYQFERNRRHSIRTNHALIASLALLGVLGLSYLVIRGQLSPIRKIQSGVQRISSGELDHRIEVKGRDDLANLTSSINSMAHQIEDRLDAKRQLLLAISHELRSPLARARLASEMLPESTNRTRLIEDLKEMDSMIQDIMETERLSQNHASLHIELCDLRSVVKKVTAQHKTISFSVEIPENLHINADKARIELMLRNIVNNAVEHGYSSKHAIEISASTAEHQGVPGVQIAIKDYGKGIDPSYLHQVTEPFFRPDTSRTRSTGGFGMGLSLALGIARAHEGTLEIYSEPEREPGTKILIWLPTDKSTGAPN